MIFVLVEHAAECGAARRVNQHWDQLRSLFDTAWPLAAEERARLLEERCDGNAELRRELEELLAAHDEASAPGSGSPAGRRFGAG